MSKHYPDSLPPPFSPIVNCTIPNSAFCPICHNDNINRWVKTSCNHDFCQECIERWLKDHKTCPICRHILIQVAIRKFTAEIVSEVSDSEVENEQDEEEEDEAQTLRDMYDPRFTRVIARLIGNILRRDPSSYRELVNLQSRLGLDIRVYYVEDFHEEQMNG